jgi:hexosaminidase
VGALDTFTEPTLPAAGSRWQDGVVDPSLNLLPRPRIVEMSGSETVLSSGSPRQVIDPSIPPQGYRLEVTGEGEVRVAAAGEPGFSYGRATLLQLKRLRADGALPIGSISDWPDLQVRAVMLDVSRCRVPTMETLRDWVDRLAEWKFNQLQLYVEHTFSYPGHEVVWEHADPLTAAEMEELVAYCKKRHIDLVANQNTLGHMERWLIHERYAPLGIIRGVGTNHLGMPVPASTLDPANPESFALVSELLDVMCGHIPSRWVNVGMDEPWDLPKERAEEWAGWLRNLCALKCLSGRDVLVWGDMLALHPELARGLPESVTVCEWGYDSGHPFGVRLGALADAGVSAWVCPGTSGWLSLVGRATNAVNNCREAAEAAIQSGCNGYLVTDWGDWGHHQPRSVSDIGLAAAAAFSWCLESNRDLDAQALASLLDRHVYADESCLLGGTLVSLGDLHRVLPLQAPNLSGLTLHFYLPQVAVGAGLTTGLTAETLDGVDEALEAALSALGRAKPGTRHGRLAVSELATAARLVGLACKDARARLAGDGRLESVDETLRVGFADELGSVEADYRRDWLERDRPGGLEESCAWIANLASCYRSGRTDPGWAGPLVALARERYSIHEER